MQDLEQYPALPDVLLFPRRFTGQEHAAAGEETSEAAQGRIVKMVQYQIRHEDRRSVQ
jgi:hypothetical protein